MRNDVWVVSKVRICTTIRRCNYWHRRAIYLKAFFRVKSTAWRALGAVHKTQLSGFDAMKIFQAG
jgi:hypothetical protein